MKSRPSDQIIVALDVATNKEALDLISKLRPDVDFFKIGLQLFIAAGPGIVRAIPVVGARVFLDLKLHDIPNTVAKAVESAGRLGVNMLTIHLSGGSEMIRAAVNARSDGMLIVGVTALTSSTEGTLRGIGVTDTMNDYVLRLAKLGVAAGIDGVVASPHEAKALRTAFGDKIKIVTPGIRPSWAEPGDQKRFATPRGAIDAGADYLVIGRPITGDPDPKDALKRILQEMGA